MTTKLPIELLRGGPVGYAITGNGPTVPPSYQPIGAAADFQSGAYYIPPATTLTVALYRQSITKGGSLVIDGNLILDGQLFLEA